MAQVAGHVHDPRPVWQEGQEGVADVLQAPVVDIQTSLDLAVMLGGVGWGVEVEGRVVDQNVNLAVLGEDLVPESHHRDNVRHLHLFELNPSAITGVHLLSGYKQRSEFLVRTWQNEPLILVQITAQSTQSPPIGAFLAMQGKDLW